MKLRFTLRFGFAVLTVFLIYLGLWLLTASLGTLQVFCELSRDKVQMPELVDFGSEPFVRTPCPLIVTSSQVCRVEEESVGEYDVAVRDATVFWCGFTVVLRSRIKHYRATLRIGDERVTMELQERD